MSDETAPEDVKLVGDETPAAPEAPAIESAATPVEQPAEVAPAAPEAPAIDAPAALSDHAKHRLHKLASHYGVPHDGDDHATAEKLAGLTGDAHLDHEAAIHELADKTGV